MSDLPAEQCNACRELCEARRQEKREVASGGHTIMIIIGLLIDVSIHRIVYLFRCLRIHVFVYLCVYVCMASYGYLLVHWLMALPIQLRIYKSHNHYQL